MKLTQLATIYDPLIGCDYNLYLCNAIELSESLKTQYVADKIDYKSFNSQERKIKNSYDKDTSDALPQEVYNYQNFFFINDNKKLKLVDGFRRLLYSKVPDIDIVIRVYDREKISDQSILKLLVDLNHTKYFGGIGSFYDRGFGLALKSIFNIDISGIHPILNTYLIQTSTKYTYVHISKHTGSSGYDMTTKRMLEPEFLSKIRFISEVNSLGVTLLKDFGQYFYEKQDVNYDSKAYAELLKSDKNYAKLVESYSKKSEYAGESLHKEIMQLYDVKFDLLNGVKPKKHYREYLEETKAISAAIKKEKGWIKLTRNNCYDIEKLYETNPNPKLEFKVVLHPTERSVSEDYDEIYGLHTDVRFDKFKKHLIYTWVELCLFIGDVKYKFERGYDNFVSYNQYKKVEAPHDKMGCRSQSFPVDIFVKVPVNQK